MKKYSYAVFIILIVSILSNNVYSKEHEEKKEKNIIVFHSYHDGLAWTDELAKGIRDALSQESVEIIVEYMDSYRFEKENYDEILYLYYKGKFENYQVDAIVVCDNYAYSFIKKYHDDLFPGVPVLFAGVSNLKENDVDRSQYTGLAENTYIKENLNMITRFHKDLEQIIVCGGNNSTSINEAKSIIPIGKQEYPNLVFKQYLVSSLDEQIKLLEKESSAVIITSGTIFDENGNLLDHSEYAKRILEETNMPVYGLSSVYLEGQGAIGGCVSSPYTQGLKLGEYAVKILNGASTEDLPIVSDLKGEYIFNYNRLEQFNISRVSLPREATLLNAPVKEIILNRNVLYLYSGIILALGSILLALVFNITKRKKAEKSIYEAKLTLMEKNRQLLHNNKEIEESRSELNKQYEELTKKNEEIEFLAYYNSLTGFMKRMKFVELVDEKIADQKTKRLTLYNITIDNMKTINDTFGYIVGNEIVIEVANLLKVTFIGEQYFMGINYSDFLLADCSSETKEIEEIAYKILKLFENTINVGNKEIDLKVNIGIASYPNDANDGETLFRNVNIATNISIKKGPFAITLYDSKYYDNMLIRTKIENQLKKAIEYEEFELYYQPKVSTNSCKIIGCEALIRWNHPENRVAYPNEFIDIAEESGMILEIGRWVVVNACEQIEKWSDLGYHIPISVNVSVKQLNDKTFMHTVRKHVQNIDSSLLEFEITETTIMKDLVNNVKMLEEIRSLGIGIALDDFGTGYSSMSYIKDLPITKLKIDRAFVINIEEKERQKQIMLSLITIGHALGYKINVEGVEKIKQFQLLRSYEADEIQGYLFSKPIQEKEFFEFIDQFQENFHSYYDS